ncbi:hypothetical protein NMG60_11000880 [Bertholletia excelsa]
MNSLFFFLRRSYFPDPALLLQTTQSANPKSPTLRHSTRLFADQSQPHVFGKTLVAGTPLLNPSSPPQSPSPELDFENNFSRICDLLMNPSFPPGPALETALDQAGIKLSPSFLQQVFDRFRTSPDSSLNLFQWAEKQPGYRSSVGIFNAMVKVLARGRNFRLAWCLILCRIKQPIGGPDVGTFAILIRRYARAGMPYPAFRTLEFVNTIDLNSNSNSAVSLFEVLMDSFCKEGLVREASEYFYGKRRADHSFVPSIHVYNILLKGFIQSRQLENALCLWDEMKKDNVKPSVKTYGILVEGHCRMHRVDKAIELVDEMKKDGIEPDAIVYNSVIDALGEAGRLIEALGIMERFLILESGPTISTFNSLVKGFCKAGDLEGANKILKMMISRGFVPTTRTYNYIFHSFSKHGRIEEALNLYAKITKSGYTPDQLTYHLLIELLCKQEMVDHAMQIRKEMKARGYGLDLAAFNMLVHLLCKMHRFEEALAEFEETIQRGIIPQYVYQKMIDELKKKRMTKMAQKLFDLMLSVRDLANLPDAIAREKDSSHSRRRSIMQKAEMISNTLKTCRDPRELVKQKVPSENAVNSCR